MGKGRTFAQIAAILKADKFALLSLLILMLFPKISKKYDFLGKRPVFSFVFHKRYLTDKSQIATKRGGGSYILILRGSLLLTGELTFRNAVKQT